VYGPVPPEALPVKLTVSGSWPDETSASADAVSGAGDAVAVNVGVCVQQVEVPGMFFNVAVPLTALGELNVPLIEVCVENGMQLALPHENEPFVIAQVAPLTLAEPLEPQRLLNEMLQFVIWLEPLTVNEKACPREVVPLYVPAPGVIGPMTIEPDFVQVVLSAVTVSCQL
jgi:hypothetical protein